MDCEKCIWGIINIFRERDRQGRARKCGGSRKRRGRKAREDIRPVFIIALHRSLTISSPFSERGSRRVGTNGRRKSCGTCRCSRWVRPTVSSYLENLNYATVIKASSSVLARGPEDEEEWKSSGANERPRRREDVLRDSTWRKGILAEESAALFRETRRTALFFYHLSLCPSLPASRSLSLAVFSRPWVTPTLGDIS